jgi:cation transport protein ChaC
MWVFGYGSLLWNPGFPFVEQRTAKLSGYRRSFSMRSIHHRGTVEDPGLVLALDVKDQAVCDGVAFLVAPEHQVDTLEYLRERELISSAYIEKILMIDVKDIGSVESVVYVIDETHDQYCDLSLNEQANIIAHAVGGRGPNWEYLRNTVNFLNDSQIYDADLQWLEAEVTKIRGQ